MALGYPESRLHCSEKDVMEITNTAGGWPLIHRFARW